MNIGALFAGNFPARQRVLGIQTKLHQWAIDDPNRRFDDLFNLVTDPAFLRIAWERVRANKGARSAGVDGDTAHYVESVRGVERFLGDLRADLRDRTFRPLPVRERMIPKPGKKSKRRLGIPTVRDRVVQAALKLVLEPIFEADFKPCSYGFRPRRRTHDAVAEIYHLCGHPRNYEWVLEADIEACFDEIDHNALMERVRHRIKDKRVLGLVKAFLKAGILTENGAKRDTVTGTPQGGILSPLLANIALAVLDDHFTQAWQSWGNEWHRRKRQLQGWPTYRLIRYADDFVVVVKGTRQDAETLRAEVAEVLRPIGLRLSAEKTRVAHIDEGFDFLGFRIRRARKQGAVKQYLYTFPSKSALASIKAKVRKLTQGGTNLPLKTLLYRLNPVLRGWANYFHYGVSFDTFDYVHAFVWKRVIIWLRKKHPHASWKYLQHRYRIRCGPADGSVFLFNPAKVGTERYRYRGARIPTPWASVETMGSQ